MDGFIWGRKEAKQAGQAKAPRSKKKPKEN
jgi:hypothetical protein